MEKHRKIVCWIKSHKKTLAIAGISTATLILLVMAIENRGTLSAMGSSLRNTISHPAPNLSVTIPNATTATPADLAVQISTTSIPSDSARFPFEVRRHIRNLPVGYHASPEKINSALLEDIALMEGQTWVKSYVKGGVAA